jgi:nuclear pore complex protein Nup107
MDIEEVFSELAASKDSRIRDEAQKMTHKVQQYLIMDQVGTLMEEMEQWIKLHTEQKRQSLRFLSHLVIFLRLIGQAKKDHIGDAVLREYVRVIEYSSHLSSIF